VHAAYGWEYPLDAGQVLGYLVALNLSRALPEQGVAA
jgi:hypothetical protein